MLRNSACGIGQIALAAMLANGTRASSVALDNPLTAKQPHFPARAKRIIFLFMWGGPSHVDTFDPKPKLNDLDGQPLPSEVTQRNQSKAGTILGSKFRFAQHGQSGLWMSELFPQLATQADRLCVIRSMHTEGTAHGEALLRLHTGQANLVRPSVGSWLSYGLGCESENLPAYVTISPPRGHGGGDGHGRGAEHHGDGLTQ